MTAKKIDFNTHLVTLVFGLLGSFAAFLTKDYYDRTWGADRAAHVAAQVAEHEQNRITIRKLLEVEGKLISYIEKNEQHWTDSEKQNNQLHESTMQAIGKVEHLVSSVMTSGRRVAVAPPDSTAIRLWARLNP